MWSNCYYCYKLSFPSIIKLFKERLALHVWKTSEYFSEYSLSELNVQYLNIIFEYCLRNVWIISEYFFWILSDDADMAYQAFHDLAWCMVWT